MSTGVPDVIFIVWMAPICYAAVKVGQWLRAPKAQIGVATQSN